MSSTILLTFQGLTLNAAASARAGIVDQNVQATEALDDLSDFLRPGIGIAHIERHVGGSRADGVRDGVAEFVSDVGDNHLGAVLREFSCRRLANTASCAGN
jgi:hypothetical protein